jgi:integrase
VRRKTRPGSQKATESIFRRLVLPAWKGRSVHDIRRRDVIPLVEGIAVARPILANRMLAALSKFFRWAVARDLITASPVTGVERPTVEVARDRYLDDGEIAQLWAACDPALGTGGAFVKMLLLTGCRRNEVARMNWSEIDANQRLFLLPAERSKNKLAHSVPLTPQAWGIIESMPRISDYVFAAARGDGAINCFGVIKDKLDAKLKFAKPWRLHDTRRSVASGMQRLGVRLEVIEAALGHTSGSFKGIVGTYQRHDFPVERRIALEKWADHIEQLTGGTPATVVQFHGKRR